MTPLLLYMEDDPHTAYMFRLAIKELECRVRLTIVETRQAALEYLRRTGGQELPGLVLLDLHLSSEDSFPVLEEIRGTPGLVHLPAVMFSTSREPEDEIRAARLGASGFIHKPMQLDAFYDAVRRICAMVTPRAAGV